MSMGYKKDIFGSFAYEFELLRFLSEAQGFTLRDAMLSHRNVAHFVRSDVMFGATRQGRASRTAGLHHTRSVHRLPERANIVEKSPTQTAPSHKEVCTCFVGTGVLDCPLAQKFDPQKTNN